MRPAGEISCVLRCLSVGGDLWSFFYTLHFDIGQCVCRASFVFPSISFFFSFIFFSVCLGESIPACNLYRKHSSLSLVPQGFFSVELGRTFPQARQREKKKKKTKYHPRNLSIPVCLWHWASKQMKKGEKKMYCIQNYKKKSPLQCCVYTGVSFIDLFFFQNCVVV